MTKNEIKEMYQSLVDGYTWECREGTNRARCSDDGCCDGCRRCEWKEFHLGDEYIEEYEYRKAKYCVVHEGWCANGQILGIYRVSEVEFKNKSKILYESYSYIECKDWYENHRCKTWFEEKTTSRDLTYTIGSKNGIVDVCNEILKCFCNDSKDKKYHEMLKDIIKSLGVDLNMKYRDYLPGISCKEILKN